MDKVAAIAKTTQEYYEKPNPVIDWNSWVFNGHVKVVDQWVMKISEKHPCDIEKTRVAAYLHDIAYAWTSKSDPTLDEQSYAKAREILSEHYDSPDVDFIIDVISKHGAHGGPVAEPMEARVLAAADAMAHIMSDFYIELTWSHYLFEDKTLDEYRAWVLKKIERDFTMKITFDDVKEIGRPRYEMLREMFTKVQL